MLRAKLIHEAARDLGFRCRAKPIFAGFAALVRRESEDVCSSVLIRHDRTEGYLRFDFWVAPVHSPSDSLNRLGIGYKILLGETWEPSDDLFNSYVRRAKHLAAHVRELVTAVEQELRDPPIRTVRLPLYLEEVAIFRKLRQDPSPRIHHVFETAWSHAKDYIAGEFGTDEFNAKCTRLGGKLIEQKWAAKHVGGELRTDAELLGFTIASQVYVNALAPWPPDDSRG